jgi:ribokinase
LDNNHRFDIITIGSATVDVFAHTDPSQSEVLNVHHQRDIAYPLGAKILIKELRFFTGGGGTNTAVAFSRLGLKTAFLGRIGDDGNAETILKNLADENVAFIGKKGGISGYSVILDSVKEDRTIFTYKGTNDDFTPKDVRLQNLDTGWFYFSSMMNHSYSVLEKVASYAARKGIPVAFNPSLYLAKKGKRYLSKVLKNTYILVFNKQEAMALMNNHADNIYLLLHEISLLGPRIVIITDGKDGVHCYDSLHKEFYHANPEHVRIVETTGAGDAFAAGFVAGQIYGKSIPFSLKLGMINAESVITHIGAKNKLLGKEATGMAERDCRKILRQHHALNNQ